MLRPPGPVYSNATTATILLVEDNQAFAATLRSSLETESYQVEWAADGESALEWLATRQADLIILDLMLPDVNGFEVLRRYRASAGGTPVLILSARDAEVDKVQGFRIGADDYVVKSTGLLELLARVQGILRRSQGADSIRHPTPLLQQYAFGGVEVDLRTRSVTKRGDAVELTPMEFDLLVYMIQHQGVIISRDELLQHVWEYSPGLASRTVDQHLSRLRIKLEDDPASPAHFLTIRKSGFRFLP